MSTSQRVAGEMREVSAAYHGDIYVLQDLSLTFLEGLVTGIIGPNGAGKSTVLRTFIGLLRPRHGEVSVFGQSTAGVPSHRMAALGVAYVPQSRSLFLDLTIEDNLELGCWPFRRDRKRMRRAIDLALTTFPELGERRSSPAGSLSGGQQRFLEISRALLLEPRLLLLDEPTAMIAPKFAAAVYQKIAALARSGLAVVLVDQNIKPCVRVSDYLYVLELGRKTAEGPTDEVRSDDGMRDMIARWLEVRGG